MSNIVPNHDGTSTATIQVPNSLVGAIMGKGGYRIKEIRMSTYAEINIAKSKSPDNNRLITVKGLKSDVQRCVILIKKRFVYSFALFCSFVFVYNLFACIVLFCIRTDDVFGGCCCCSCHPPRKLRNMSEIYI